MDTSDGSTRMRRATSWRRDSTDAGIHRLRELAREGRLADSVRSVDGAALRAITGAAYGVAWPIVFDRLTRRYERRRGHLGCATAVYRLRDDCLDRFHDDVEGVVDDLLAHARGPIQDLDAWIASRLTAATVNWHRRLRGRRGALQRPRIPVWLARQLGGDRWLTTLATEILVWVGVPATAGVGLWPLDAWTQRRGEVTGDWAGGDPGVVAREVETVLAVMRQRLSWYERYVEAPLGRKQAPVAFAPPHLDAARPEQLRPLPVRDPADDEDAELTLLAATAVRAIAVRLSRGEPAGPVVVDVLGTVFGQGLPGSGLDRRPHDGADDGERLPAALADRSTVGRLVATVLEIIALDRPTDERAATRPPVARSGAKPVAGPARDVAASLS